MTLTFDLLQGQICCQAGDHNSPNLLVINIMTKNYPKIIIYIMTKIIPKLLLILKAPMAIEN